MLQRSTWDARGGEPQSDRLPHWWIPNGWLQQWQRVLCVGQFGHVGTVSMPGLTVKERRAVPLQWI